VFEGVLQAKHPLNHNIRAKARIGQQLRFLRARRFSLVAEKIKRNHADRLALLFSKRSLAGQAVESIFSLVTYSAPHRIETNRK
jgi:hypothetical protein